MQESELDKMLEKLEEVFSGFRFEGLGFRGGFRISGFAV